MPAKVAAAATTSTAPTASRGVKKDELKKKKKRANGNTPTNMRASINDIFKKKLPNVSVRGTAKALMNAATVDVIERILTESETLLRLKKTKTVSLDVIDAAAKSVLSETSLGHGKSHAIDYKAASDKVTQFLQLQAAKQQQESPESDDE